MLNLDSLLNKTESDEELRRLVSLQKNLIADQQAQLGERQALLLKKDREIEELRRNAEAAWEYVRLMRLQRFTPSSEKMTDLQGLLFNEAEVLAAQTGESSEDEVEVPGYKRKRGKRKPLADHLLREERIIELSPEERMCPKHGAVMQPVGEEVSEKLEVIPQQVHVIRTKRIKYGCGDECMKCAPVEPTLIPKSLATETTLATVVGWKFELHLPLYRIEGMLDRIGVDVSRGTMARWMVKCGEAVQPLINLLEERQLETGYIQMDETPVQVLKEPGKTPQSKSFMWVRATAAPTPIVLFEYDPTRSGQVPLRLLKDYKGFLQVDGYDGYSPIAQSPVITRLGCMAHLRRKFNNAKKAGNNKTGLAHQALTLIAGLYKIEEAIRGKPAEERKRVRDLEARPILDELKAFIDKHRGGVPKESLLGKAFTYAVNEWPYLIGYLQDGRLEIDNNLIENTIRPFALGRKNWLFSDTVEGAKASANLYSLVVTARLNGLNVHAYLKFVFEGLARAQTLDDIERLLPQNAPASVRLRKPVN